MNNKHTSRVALITGASQGLGLSVARQYARHGLGLILTARRGELLDRVLAAELEGSGVRVVVLDPGDMNTEMHRAAEPGVDLSHLPEPEQVASAFVQLLQHQAAFARIQAQGKVDAAI